jgi:tRNA modification GTPase
VLNKRDLDAAIAVSDLRALVGNVPVVELSAHTGEGLADLEAALARALVPPSTHAGTDDEAVIFRERHRDAARRAAEAMARAEHGLAVRAPVELIASDLAAAATALGAITGEITSEDVLDRVFAEFCVGK